MIQVLIIDDDATTRTGLKTMIHWETYGFEVIGEASNGAVGIEFVKEYWPDLVITDMNMPILDGVAVIEWMQQEAPDTMVLALSGYDDFNYVKSSMKGGAIDYLLKHHLDEKQLIASLELIQQKMKVREEQHQEQRNAKAHTFLQQQQRRSDYLQKLILEVFDEELHQSSLLVELGLPAKMINNVLVIIDLDNFNVIEKQNANQTRKITETFSEVIHQIAGEYKDVFPVMIRGNQFVLLHSFGSSYSTLFVYNQIYRTIERIQLTLSRYLNMTACYAVSSLYVQIQKTHEVYLLTQKYLQNRIYKGKNKIFMADDVEVIETQFLTLTRDQEKLLTQSLREGNSELIERQLNQLFEQMIHQRISLKAIQMMVSEMIRLCHLVANEHQMPLASLYQSEESPLQILSRYDTLEDIATWLVEVFTRLCTQIVREQPDQSYSETIQRAMTYIHKNYALDISLQDTADATGVSSSHLSRLFKEECDTNYIKYLNKLRVEQAKVLIEEGQVKLKNIVEEVGFRNYNYFFKVFKDYTQLTPQEYEQQIRSKKQST